MRRNFADKHKGLLAVFFILIISFGTVAAPIPPDKMKPEEVVAKHLAAIGPADALASVKSVIVIGNARAATRLDAVKGLTGPAQLASDGDKVLLAMLFNSTSYPQERASYNGQNLTLSLLPDGKRSILGNFLKSNDAVFKQGLIGGVLSSAWPLLNITAKNLKLSYSGTKKINDRPVHELKFDPRKSGGMQISLFFDAETFQHVRTEYQYVIAARMGARPEDSISQLESRYKLTEDFSDFKTEGKLTLPHTYKIRCTIEERNNTQMLEWTLTLAQFAFNEPIDANVFSGNAGS